MSVREDPYLDRFSEHRSSRRARGSRKPTIDDLKLYLQKATRVETPNLALNLDIADMVNTLKGDAPKIVCNHVAKYMGGYYGAMPFPSIVLSILDVCVKNCGYPFHLAISRKDFLNKFVSSFSYRPPPTLSSKQLTILEMIEEWNLTIAKTSVYRDDLGNIRDMRRLLASRGYVFPKISNSELLALSVDQNNLKSAAELEREEHERQTCKMQMLLGSKNPEDLKEANRLMSILAGYQESQVDYRAKVAADLEKLRRTKDLLLSAISSGINQDSSGDVFDELSNTLNSSIPKLKRLLQGEASESEDPEAHERVTKLLYEMESAIAQYKAAITGEHVDLPPVPNGGAGAAKKAAGISLIDIDGDDETPSNDLLSLSLGPSTPQPSSSGGAALSLASSSQASAPAQAPAPGGNDLLDIFGSSAPVAPAASSAAASTSAAAAVPSSEIWSDDSLKVSFTAEKTSASSTTLVLKFVNPGPKKITNLETQLAQPRSLSMELSALTQSQLEPRQEAVQKVVLTGEATPKLRWKANYNFGLDKRTANGDIKNVA